MKVYSSLLSIAVVLCAAMLLSACTSGVREVKEEQVRVDPTSRQLERPDSVSMNSVRGNLSLSQINAYPNSVVLTGLPQHRLVTIYKSVAPPARETGYSSRGYYDYDNSDSEETEHYMPGIDLIYGYNLLNVAHYDLVAEKLNFLFDHPVLVKTIYYPSFEQDSLYKQPINRDYYFLSVYDQDTNADTLINKKDLRRFYYFNASCTERIQLVPPEYSVARSQYDPRNDVMYLFARHDANKNGVIDKKEPLHIFWVKLKSPAEAKRLY